MKKITVLNKNIGDRSLLITIFSFLLFGLIMIANATAIHSNTLYDDPYRFVLLQAGWIALGLVGFFIFYRLDYRHLEKVSFVLFVVNLGLLAFLALVSFLPCTSGFGFAPCVNGANRWLYLNPAPFPKLPFLGVAGFQPSEMAKLTLIMYLSVQLSKRLKNGEDPFWAYFITSLLVAGLIILEPNMSTAVMVFAIGTVIFFASGASLKKLYMLVPPALVSIAGFILLSPYRRTRLFTLLGLGNSSTTDLTMGYHIKQILIALGSGGIFGVGFGQSRQKYQYLPEVASDSIFAIIGEEFGFIGTTLVIIAFSYLIYKGFSIAKRTEDPVGKLMAVGITAWIALQFFVNVGAMAQIIPLTGVPLPLISYGGSSMVFTLMALGILANISKSHNKEH